VTDNRPLLELIREVTAEVTVEEKDFDETDLVVDRCHCASTHSVTYLLYMSLTVLKTSSFS